MSKRRLYITILMLSTTISCWAGRTYEALKMGIVSDGKTLNTQSIQKAIDQIGKKGGCLQFGPGTYLTGSIVLRSNVEIRLERGATLLGSDNPFDYQALELLDKGDDRRNDNSQLALILAQGATNITLSGEGCIDGNGMQLALAIDSLHHAGVRIDPNYNLRRKRTSETMRPKLFFMVGCKNIRVEGLELKNSACWGLSFDLCEHLILRKLNITNRAYWNNDGIDLTDCKHSMVEDCDINSADDGVCLKSYHANSRCDDIIIRRCSIRSSASAVKFGTASWGGFENIVIDSIRIRDTFRSAIAIESVDGGNIHNIHVKHVYATNTGNPIFIRLGHRAGERPGCISSVEIEDFYAEVPFGRPDINYDLRGPEVDFFHNPMPSVISGIPEHPIEDITIRNARIIYPGRASKAMAYVPLSRLNDIPEAIDSYPEFTMFGELPAWGFFLRHVRNIRLLNVELSTHEEDFRPAIVPLDVIGFEQSTY